MDPTKRQMTKIAREVSKLAGRMLRDQGIGTAEFDVVHVIRKNPGITQAGIRDQLGIDKGAMARQIASLEAKGFLIRKENPQDGRSQLLYATEKADQLKNSKAYIESVFYEWLLEPLSDQQRQEFAATLETLYLRSREQSRAGFPEVVERLEEKEA
ncbi:MAG: MarR family transcriptional regulator [Oscillospiraceae bacterium]|nr:MarR family transcriptional regulator [Oscillospiraceae bacterium]